jgi:hypothetical protein
MYWVAIISGFSADEKRKSGQAEDELKVRMAKAAVGDLCLQSSLW